MNQWFGNIVIDDERTFTGGLIVDRYLRTSSEALEFLARYLAYSILFPLGAEPKIVTLWLDHDLGGHDDIMPVVNFLIATEDKYAPIINEIRVHSQNPVGADNVVRSLQDYYNVVCSELPPCRSDHV